MNVLRGARPGNIEGGSAVATDFREIPVMGQCLSHR